MAPSFMEIKMYKDLIFTDLHLHTWMSFGVDHETGLPRRLVEQRDVLNQILEIAITNGVKRIFFGGDWYHMVGTVPTLAMNVGWDFMMALRQRGIAFYACTGNHDLVVLDTPLDIHSSIYKYKMLGGDLDIPGVRLISYGDIIDDSVVGYDLVLLHKTPAMLCEDGFVFQDGVDWVTLSKNNRHVVFGHHHKRQLLNANTQVLGSPMHYNFGDSGDRGVLVGDITSDAPLQFLKLKYPEFLTVGSAKEIVEGDTYNYYRVKGDASGVVPSDHVIVQTVPEVYTERIVGGTLGEMCKEWLGINPVEGEDYVKHIDVISGYGDAMFAGVYRGKLKSVLLKDFFSCENISYEIRNGLVYVQGDNGHGKSTLFEAILWALHGETTKGLTGDDVVRDGCKDCFIS